VYLLFSTSNNEIDLIEENDSIPQTPPGLVNFGNICFVNSSLQVSFIIFIFEKLKMLIQKALASMKSFRKFLAVLMKDFHNLKINKFDQNSNDLIEELQKMLASIYESQISIKFPF